MREGSFQLTQDSVRFAQAQLDDLIGARLRIAVCIDAELRRVARRPNMGNVSVAEIEAQAIEHVDAHDVIEPERGCEKTH